VALDQLTTDCLALAATFVATMSPRDEGRLRRGDTGRHRRHRSSLDDDRPPAGRSRAEARVLNTRSQAHLQLLVDAFRDSRPEPERVYELRVIQDESPTSHQVLCCSDARVVFAEAGEGALRSFTVFAHGTLDVENKLLRARAELRMGPKPVLIWPRLAGKDDEIDVGVRQVMSGPSRALHALQTRVARGERGRITLTAGAPAAGTSAVAPGWHPDPTGRHDHRWWDGSTWTANAADDGVAVHDPI
jgi:hypothetical protein